MSDRNKCCCWRTSQLWSHTTRKTSDYQEETHTQRKTRVCKHKSSAWGLSHPDLHMQKTSCLHSWWGHWLTAAPTDANVTHNPLSSEQTLFVVFTVLMSCAKCWVKHTHTHKLEVKIRFQRMETFLILRFRWQTETYGHRPLGSVTYLVHKTCVNAQTHTTPQVAWLYVLTVHISREISRGMHCTANRCSNSSLFISSYLTHTLFQTLSPPDALHELWVLEEVCARVFVHACLYMWKGVERKELFMIS